MAKTTTFTLIDGREMPAVGLGTYAMFQRLKDLERNGQTDYDRYRTAEPGQYRQAVEWAIDDGYRHIDTAAIYKNELEVGQGINNKINDGTIKRKQLWVTTKLWNDQHAPENVLPALRESLNKLNLDYVDLYLIHWPVALTASDEDAGLDFIPTWLQMEEAQRRGLAKSIGVSNFNREQLERLIQEGNVKPAVNQFELNPTLTQYPLVEYCKSQGIQVTAYTPLGTMSDMRSSDGAPTIKRDDLRLTAIGNKYGKTTTQVVLKYIIQRGIAAIPKSFTRSRITANLQIFDFSLTAEEMSLIDSFNVNYRCVPVTGWKGYNNYPF